MFQVLKIQQMNINYSCIIFSDYGYSLKGRASVDGSASFETNESLELDMLDAGEILPSEIVYKVKSNPAFFVSLSDNELQSIVDVRVEDLSVAIGKNRLDAKIYQEACEKELHRRTEIKEATELLKLYDKASREKTLSSSEAGSKRLRDEKV